MTTLLHVVSIVAIQFDCFFCNAFVISGKLRQKRARLRMKQANEHKAVNAIGATGSKKTVTDTVALRASIKATV